MQLTVLRNQPLEAKNYEIASRQPTAKAKSNSTYMDFFRKGEGGDGL